MAGVLFAFGLLCITHNIEPIPVLSHQLPDKFFPHCPLHANPLVQQIGNSPLADLTNLYKKYKHKRMKHILLELAHRKLLFFFCS